MPISLRRAPDRYDREDQSAFRADVEREDRRNLKRGQDYEEGAFTPTIGDGTNNYTLDRALGFYTKIGNMVFVDIDCRWTGIGSAGAGQLTIKTLPFATNATTGYQAAASIGYFDDLDTTAALNQIMGYVGTNSTSILFYRAVDNGGATALAANSSGATGEVVLSIAYRI